MKTLYFDCSSGISGDMTVAALLDLGVDEQKFSEVLEALALPGYQISHKYCMKNGIRARRFEVNITQHEHHHRTLQDILTIFRDAELPQETRFLAEQIFYCIAQAEGKIHGKSIKDVHFHEVGAIDSIIDILAVAECIRQIAPERIVFSNIREGHGMIECAHGLIPIPAPATLEILKGAGAVLTCTDNIGEMVTPTGAGIAATIGNSFGEVMPEGIISAIGYGSGMRDFAHPNILRIILLEEKECKKYSEMPISVLEAQVDDMTGEQLGFALEQFFTAGALDAYFAPIYMKKNRPATLISIFCNIEDEEKLGNLLLKHTTTLGYRVRHTARCTMHRDMIEVSTPYGNIPVKRAVFGDIIKYHPEFEAICSAAREANVEVTKVLASVNLQLAQLASCNF